MLSAKETLDYKAKLAQKVLAVMKAVQGVPKNGHYDQNGVKYDYAKESDIADAVRKGQIDANLAILPTKAWASQEPTGTQTKSGVPNVRTNLDLAYELVDAETGFSHTIIFPSECIEAGDKGLSKAIVNNQKYMTLTLFSIPKGIDPDASAPDQDGKAKAKAPAVPLPTFRDWANELKLNENQRKFIEQSCEVAGVPIERFIANAIKHKITTVEKATKAAHKIIDDHNKAKSNGQAPKDTPEPAKAGVQ